MYVIRQGGRSYVKDMVSRRHKFVFSFENSETEARARAHTHTHTRTHTHTHTHTWAFAAGGRESGERSLGLSQQSAG